MGNMYFMQLQKMRHRSMQSLLHMLELPPYWSQVPKV